MKTTISYYDMTLLDQYMIWRPRDQREIWVDMGYWSLFCVRGGWWGIILGECALFWVGGTLSGWG